MAEKESKGEAKDGAAEKPKKGKAKLFIIIGVALVLLLGGGGAAAYFMMGKKKKETAAHAKAAAEDDEEAAADDKHAKADAAADDEEDDEEDPPKKKEVKKAKKTKKKKKNAAHPPVFVEFEMFTANLKDTEDDRFIQVKVVAEMKDAPSGEALKAMMPAVRNEVLMLLGSKESREVLTREGKEKLAAEIVSAANQTLEGSPSAKGVESVNFTHLIVQ